MERVVVEEDASLESLPPQRVTNLLAITPLSQHVNISFVNIAYDGLQHCKISCKAITKVLDTRRRTLPR